MSIIDWLNSDFFDELRDKINATFDLLKGGTAGQKFVSDGTGNPSWQDDNTALPSQTGNNGKYLTTDGTTPSWVPIVIPTAKVIFLAGKSGALNQIMPNSGSGGQGPSVIGNAIILPNDALNRDCLLTATVDVSGISTSPDDLVGFYKNGSLLKEWKFVVRNDYSAASIEGISHFAPNCSPNDVLDIRIRVTGSTNQINVLSYSFTVLGNPL